jgi:hypothetical protein
MRRLVLLAVLALSYVAPSTVAAGGCPTDPGGLVDKDSYRIGELIQFFDSYTDFGDPGMTTIHFERPADGTVLDYTATNIADGTWFLDLRLDSSSFVGRWDVTVTVDQTSGIDTCTDVVTIRALGAPSTDMLETRAPMRWLDLLVIAALIGGAMFIRRGRVAAER